MFWDVFIRPQSTYSHSNLTNVCVVVVVAILIECYKSTGATDKYVCCHFYNILLYFFLQCIRLYTIFTFSVPYLRHTHTRARAIMVSVHSIVEVIFIDQKTKKKL